MVEEPTIPTIASMAVAHMEDDASEAESSTAAQVKTKEQARRHYVRTLHKVIDQSDIVVLVLDARDPEGCRSRLVEEEVRRREAEGKKLVFVLNKIGACILYYILTLDNSKTHSMQIWSPRIMLKLGCGTSDTQHLPYPSAPPPMPNAPTSARPPHLPSFAS